VAVVVVAVRARVARLEQWSEAQRVHNAIIIMG
jgi:hypothetical protein